MAAPSSHDATRLLAEAVRGNEAAIDRLVPLVYDELRRLARSYLARERPDHTLEPTELVHEAYRRLVGSGEAEWEGRTHFLATGARVMRRILVDHGRERAAQKRQAPGQRVTLSGVAADRSSVPLLDLLEVLDRLAELNERHHETLLLRYFGGLSVAETASHLGVSERTVERDTRAALAWVRSRLA